VLPATRLDLGQQLTIANLFGVEADRVHRIGLRLLEPAEGQQGPCPGLVRGVVARADSDPLGGRCDHLREVFDLRPLHPPPAR